MKNFCEGHRTTRLLTGLVVGTAVLGFLVSSQRAQGYSLSNAANYVVLYEGSGSHNLQINSSPYNNGTVNATIYGNIGLGDENGGNPQGQFNNPAVIDGNIDFAAAAPNLNGNAIVNGSTNANVSDVESALNYVNNLSSTLGAEVGSNLVINAGNNVNQIVNVSGGELDGSGNDIFTVSSLNLQNGGTLTINGTSSQYAVLNIDITNGLHFAGGITLIGGITPGHVLFNMYIGNDLLLTGGDTDQTAANNAAQYGTFLDPAGTINVNSVNIMGHLFGGDSSDMSIVSGGTVDMIPEPSTWTLVALGMTGAIVALRRRQR